MVSLRKGLVALSALFRRLENGALVSALTCILFIALMQILLRNVFDSGFLWAESFLRVLVLWIALLGAMVATREKNHISIDLLSRVLNPQQFILLRVISFLFSGMICGVVAYQSFLFVSFEYEDATIAFADVPVWLCQSIIPLGFGVMAFRFLLSAFKRAQ